MREKTKHHRRGMREQERDVMTCTYIRFDILFGSGAQECVHTGEMTVARSPWQSGHAMLWRTEQTVWAPRSRWIIGKMNKKTGYIRAKFLLNNSNGTIFGTFRFHTPHTYKYTRESFTHTTIQTMKNSIPSRACWLGSCVAATARRRLNGRARCNTSTQSCQPEPWGITHDPSVKDDMRYWWSSCKTYLIL
jgi:hypothetical protein